MLKVISYILLFFVAGFSKQDLKSFSLRGHAQGTTWNVTYFSEDSTILKNSIDSIFNSIDSSLSVYKPYSTIVAFNKSERGIRIDRHLSAIIRLSQKFTKETNGLSDITIGALTEYYGFGAKAKNDNINSTAIQNIRKCVGSEHISLQKDSLIKTIPCVTLDVNGIAQGYTVDVIGKYLESKGVKDYLVEVGGELRSKGIKYPGNKHFQVGIETPSDDDFDVAPMQQIISLANAALTTSGNYRKYYESNGKRHSHIIDPRSGESVDNEMISATVYATDATTADALDNALMLMGVKEALKFVEQRPDIAAFLIYKDAEGNVKDTASSRFRNLIVQR